MEKSYEHLKSLKEKNGAAEFEAEIPEAALEAHMRTELARTGRDLSVPGFRKGKVPEHMLREYVDERELLEAAADKALNDAVREIIKDEALSILGRPELTITEVAPKKPVRFKMRVALFPAIALPDYKTISATIVGRRTAAAATDTNMDAKAKANTGADEKELLAAKEAEREEIMNEIVKRAKVRVPELLIDQEWRAFVEARDADLARAGLPLEEYLKQIKKDEKSLEKDERALIEKQIVTSLVFREIKTQEHITANEQEIRANLAYLERRYSDRDRASLRQTAEAVILQEKVFDMLGAGIEAK